MRATPADVEFENSSFVAVLKLEAVGKTYKRDKNPPSYALRGQSLVTVKKVFKGDLKTGEKLVFRQLQSSMCGWSFSAEYVGKEFLLYLAARSPGAAVPKKPEVWSADICSGSGMLEYKLGDISYLENYTKVRGKTRISGMVRKYTSSVAGQSNKDEVLADHRLTISGNGKLTELRTNKDGLFEVYDLPPGKYSLTSDPVEGYRLNLGKLTVEFEIRAGRHFEQDFVFTDANRAQGILESMENLINPFSTFTNEVR